MSKEILVASTNPGKLRELRELLGPDIAWRSLGDFPDVDEVLEDGRTFAENARKKALGYAAATELWTIADDSGLVVDALNGAPGVNSARFSGEKAADRGLLDHKNMAKVLELMRGVPEKKRTCRFVCHLCLAGPQGVLLEAEGTLEGVIAERQKGSNGFGYDPIVYVPKLRRTAAELSSEEKNAISHRGNAIRKLRPGLEKLLKEAL